MNVWRYRGLPIETPENMSAQLWKRLRNYVDMLRPDDANDGRTATAREEDGNGKTASKPFTAQR